MKLSKRILALLLTIFMMLPTLAEGISAAAIEWSSGGGVYKIANDYVRFVYNSNTGAFSMETKEGHPQKSFDNDIPLLYSEAAGRSNGTSYTTVRIDGKDYIFGQDYSWFGIETDIYTPVISNGGRVMTVSWGVKGYLITQTAVISEIEDSDLAGNIGIGYTVVNMNDTDGTVGIRLLLDNALDSKIDAPYVLTDAIFSPTIVETEYSDAAGDMPAQLTFVDSLSSSKKMAYALLKGWSGEEDTTPDKVIVGHWANLANTRYDYIPDTSCDFSNYSNVHRIPDTATAIYWSEETVAANSSRTMEMLYGIGNFTNEQTDEHLGIGLNVPSVKLDSTGKAYENDGEIDILVTLDNSVDGALDLITARVDIFLDDGLTFADSGLSEATFNYGEILGDQILSMGLPVGKTETIVKTIVVSPEANLTSKSVTVNISCTEMVTETEWIQQNYTSQRNILVPGVDDVLPDVKMTSVSPKTVYVDGEKNITVSGDMESLRALKASTGWELYLVKGLHEIRIDKSTIAFPGDTYKTLTFSTDERMNMGDYRIEFRFTDEQLKAELTDKIIAAEKIEASNDTRYRAQSYGLVAMVRFEKDGYPVYDLVSCINEEQLKDFEEGNIELRGLKHQQIKFDDSSEIMAVVRGKIRVMTEGDKVFYQANPSDGDVTINNLLVYEGDEPVTMAVDGDWGSTDSQNTVSISGKGTIKVIGSITIWHHGWSLEGKDREMHTLVDPDEGEEFSLSLGIGGSILQYIGGLLIELKYGVMTKDEESDLYGISFGGKVTIPIKPKQKADASSNNNNSNSSNSGSSGGNSDSSGGNSGSSGGNSGSSGGNSGSSGGNSGSSGGNSGSSGGNSGNSGNKKPLLELTKPSGDNPPKLTPRNTDSKVGKYIEKLGTIEDEPDEGAITAEIEDIIFGHKSYNEETGEYETGFVGINTSLEVELPADVLGGLFKNKFGITAMVSINTIDKAFAIDLGVDVVNAFECELNLAFKQITRKNVTNYYPDEIKLYLGGDFMRIPFFGVPGTFVTGIGGGVSNLSDTLKDKDEGEEIAPLTIHVRLDLIFAELLCGEFEGQFSNEFVEITGEMHLNNDDDGKILKVDAGVNVRWKPTVDINIYGNATILDGLIKGGISIKIAKNYFYAYGYYTLCVPESIPIIGGYELAGVEAAGSVDFIGANLKIIGIKFGFIYYWGGDFHIGQGIDLSSRGGAVTALDTSYYDENGEYVQCTALYGTNLRRLASTRVDSGRAGSIVITKHFDPSNEDALLIEVPFDGVKLPTAEDIHLITPSGIELEMIPDDGKGGGNFLINDRGENAKKYVYITVTDKELLEEGDWTLSIATDGVTISNFEVSGVENLPDIKSTTYSYDAAEPCKLTVNYELDGVSDVPGALDIYITDNKDAISGLRQNVTDPNSNLIAIDRIELDSMEDGSVTVELPDTLIDGDYYVLCMLSQDIGGMSMVMSEDAFTFKNDKLPCNVDGISVTYGGDGDLRIEIEREEDVPYDAYFIKILDSNMNLVENAIFEETVGSRVYNEELGGYENEIFYFGEHQGLRADQGYIVAIDTVRYEGDTRYYSAETVYSDKFIMPKKEPPILLDVTTNLDPDADVVSLETFEATYTFDRDVYFYLVVDNLTKSYSTECKKVHTVSVPLIEGEHMIDFYAVTPVYDTTDSTVYEDAGFGFTVDTTAPSLSVGQSVSANIEDPTLYTAVSQQNVIVDENGQFTFNGVTDPGTVLTLCGTDEGITRMADGTFTVERTVELDRSITELVLSASDKAGNETTMLIHLLMPSVSDFTSVDLSADKDIVFENDIKKITIPVGTTVNFSAFGISDATKAELTGDDISWSVLYEKNIIDFNEGTLTALVPGETAICVSYDVAAFEVDGKEVTSTLTDVIVVEVTERKLIIGTDSGEGITTAAVTPIRTDYRDYSKVALVIETEDANSVVASIGGKETKFYYTGNNIYVASFPSDISDEVILTSLIITKADGDTVKPIALLRGDFDGNGVVNETDTILAINTFLGKETSIKIDESAYIRGDINGDGIINIIDAQLMLMIKLGK